MGIADTPRQLLIFAPDPGGAGVGVTRRRLDASRAECEDRDLRVRYLSGSRDEAVTERARWGVDPDESVAILIGRDGGAKLRAELPVEPETVFALIDTMPMRRREMAEKQSRSDGT